MITIFCTIYVNLLYFLIVSKIYNKQYEINEEIIKGCKNMLGYIMILSNLYYGGLYITNYGKFELFDIIMLIFITISVLLIFSCKRVLGKYYKFRTTYPPNQKIISTGLYKYFVHPSTYFHNILLICIMLFFQYPLYLIVTIEVLNYLIDRNRITNEENMMYLYFEDDYRTYCDGRWLPNYC